MFSHRIHRILRDFKEYKIYPNMKGFEYTEFVADCVTTAGA